MSLIREALKKAQHERDKSAADDSERSSEHSGPIGLTPRKLIIYSAAFLSLVIISVLIGIFYTPDTGPGIKLTNHPVKPPVQPPLTPQKTIKKDTSPQAEKPLPEKVEEKEEKKDSPSPALSPVSPPSEEKGKKSVTTPPTRKKQQKSQSNTNGSNIKGRVRAGKVPRKSALSAPSDFEKLVSEGERFHAEKNYDMALDKYRQALKIEASVSLYLKIYSVCRAMGNNILASGYIDAGLKQFPDSFAINKVAAILNIRQKNFSRALEHIETALIQNSRDYALLTYKGLCYFHQQKYEPALESFRKSLAVNDDALENYYYIGLIYDNLKNYKKALEFYTVFFKLNPGNKNFKHRDWVVRRIKQLQDFLKN